MRAPLVTTRTLAMGTTSSSSRPKAAKAVNAGGATDAAAEARAAKKKAMSQPTLKNIRRVQDIYDMKSVLGTGGYAVVWTATHKATKEEFAIKVMKATASSTPQDDEVTVDEIRNEIEVMRKLEHPNVIYIKEYFVQSGKFYIVMACLKGGELLDALLDLGNYTEEDAKCIAKQLLDALAYMHMNNVTHRDLKLENLLLARPNDISSVVIADFGLARNSKNARQVFQTQCGTPSYVAPEILLGKAYSPAVDVWSMGVILYTLLIGSFPFAHDDQQSLFRLICSGKMDDQQPEWASISDDVKDLLKGLLDVDPKKRLTAADALNHTWFTNEQDCSSHDLRKSHLRLANFADAMKLNIKVFQAGQALVIQGEIGKEVFLIREGTCDVLVKDADGSQKKVAMRGKGDFIGEMAVSVNDAPGQSTIGKPRTASVVATSTVTATCLTKSDMQWAVDHDYSLENQIDEVIAQRTAELAGTR